MNTEETQQDHYRLTHQQQRFCDEYLTHFNAFKAAVNSGYSENTSRKGALLHVPKIQHYLKEAMNRRSQRLEITHDMILRELSKIAFSNMGNYYDEYGCLKRMNELTVDEKGAIAYYDIVEIQDAESFRVGQQSRIKLHNKMSALDKIARHLGFYGLKPEAGSLKREAFLKEGESPKSESPEVGKMGGVAAAVAVAGGVGDSPMSESREVGKKEESPVSESREDDFEGVENTPLTSRSVGTSSLERGNRFESDSVRDAAVVDRSSNNLPMDYPVEDFELEGIDLKTLVALEGVNVSPGSLFSPESEVGSLESEGWEKWQRQ